MPSDEPVMKIVAMRLTVASGRAARPRDCLTEHSVQVLATIRFRATGRQCPGRLTELIAMTCRPDTDRAVRPEWLLWLDLRALSPRNPGVASVRRKFDERWRQTISATILAGQETGEFALSADADEFAVTLSALL